MRSSRNFASQAYAGRRMEPMFKIPKQAYTAGIRKRADMRVKAGALEQNP